MHVKTSIIIPQDLYREVKRRAVEEGKTMKQIVIEALLEYLGKDRGDRTDRERLIRLVTRSVEVAGPNDLREQEYEDLDVR